MIYHLQVGSKTFTPTPEDLQKVVEEFQKSIPVFAVPVKVNEINLGDMLKFGAGEERLVLHINDPDWNPTEKEVEALRAMFQAAMLDPNKAVVATRHGVRVSTSQKPFVSTEE